MEEVHGTHMIDLSKLFVMNREKASEKKIEKFQVQAGITPVEVKYDLVKMHGDLGRRTYDI